MMLSVLLQFQFLLEQQLHAQALGNQRKPVIGNMDVGHWDTLTGMWHGLLAVFFWH